MKRTWVLTGLVFAGILPAQQADIVSKIIRGAQERPAIAVPDFRGSGDAQQHMARFNQTLWDELSGSGVLRMVSKSFYPAEIPQQPSDFKAPAPAPVRSGQRAGPPVRQGPWLTDWSAPPVNAQYLAFGFTGAQGNQLVLSGWLYGVQVPDISGAQLIGKRYFGSMDEAGARRVAQEFAADILQYFGAKSLMGSKIFFVSDRTGAKEIWSMDYDGGNQKQLTNYKSTCLFPVVSADGTKIAFQTFARTRPEIYVHSVETGRRLTFYNQEAPTNTTPEFTPDGRAILYAASITKSLQIYQASPEGGNLRRLTHGDSIDVSPRVNPKTGNEVVFISGRSGYPQLYKMNSDGADVVRLTNGEGEVANPAWHPEGSMVAFAWTRGFEPGNYNIFLMNVVTRDIVQLTHGSGRNENPWWAPDGRHLVFSSRRGGRTQIYTMLADGTEQKQLTTQGNNVQAVWGKGIN